MALMVLNGTMMNVIYSIVMANTIGIVMLIMKFLVVCKVRI